MTSSSRIIIREESQIGEARRKVNEYTRRLGYREDLAGRAAIIVTELASNLVRHAKGGDFILREVPGKQISGLEFLTLDKGPGIRNVTECLRDGYSTNGTAGTGLGAIKRLSTDFDIFSEPTRGTVVWAALHPDQRESGAFITGAVSVALLGEELCGDAWEVFERSSQLRMIVADGLGHGAFAAEASREAVAVVTAHAEKPLVQSLEAVHHALIKTRGAAGAIVDLNPAKGQATSVGVGNISMRLVQGGKSKSLICENGTLGANVRRIGEFHHAIDPDFLLVMHSDGISANWNLSDYPGLIRHHPAVISGLLFRDFRRERDDATVVVTRRKR